MSASIDIVEIVEDCLGVRGNEMYFGEPVTQRAHALQCARLAEQSGANDALVVAALLHDIGHLVHDLGESIADDGIDARHEEFGQRWLSRYFGLEVTEPVRLHVAAKRYLCGCDRAYEASLSEASRQSLALQGGPLSPRERTDFAELPFARDAVRLRRWDDQAKRPGVPVPELAHYVRRLREAARLIGHDEA